MSSDGNPSEAIDRRRWLCIAYAFPPINRSGTHRTLGFVKHLAAMGWDATILTVEPRDEPLDEILLGDVPESTVVLRTEWTDWVDRIKHRLPIGEHDDASRLAAGAGSCERASAGVGVSAARARDWFSRLVKTPDSRTGWIGPAVRAGMREIRLRRPAILYSTSPYMSAHLIALILSRRTGLRWVADFRDPWTFNPFRELPYSSLRRLDAWLERRVLRRASHVVCSTPNMTAEMCRRFSFVRDKCSTILNGFDSLLLRGLKPERIAPDDHFVLTHCGQFYGGRSPNVWFAAIRRVLRDAPELRGKLHFAMLGPTTFGGQSLHDLATRFGIADTVCVLGRKSHASALAHMAGSDALMLAASGGPGGDLQVPNKLFEYIAIRKPIVATCPRGNPSRTILSEARAVAIVCEPDDERAISEGIVRLARHRQVSVEAPWSGVERFARSRRAEELLAVFDRVARNRRVRGSARGALTSTLHRSETGTGAVLGGVLGSQPA